MRDFYFETYLVGRFTLIHLVCVAVRSFGGGGSRVLWAWFCRCGRAGDGGIQPDGYINGPAAVYCGNTEGYLCGPQQHDSTRQRRTRHAHTETEQTHILHGSGSQVPVLVRDCTDIRVIQCFHCLFKAHMVC